MQKISVVIVCKNEANVIGETISSFAGLTDDIVVYDNGSNDGTREIVRKTNTKLVEGIWDGFGQTKNKANALAKYDWILSLDADEAIDQVLKNNLLKLDLSDERKVYQLKFKNYFGNKWLRFGEWGTDKHIRLFNRKQTMWNDAEVHESLISPDGVRVISVKGFVLHRTTPDSITYENKMKRYAFLNAKKYFQQGKKSSTLKIYLSPAFSFIKNYIFKLGFLDGKEGFDCARINALYTFIKYKKLKKLNSSS